MKKEALTTVTPFSKIVALILFALLPFAGFYLGIQYQKNVAPAMESNQEQSPSQEETTENIDPEESEEDTSEGVEEDTEPTIISYTGTAIEAEHPDDWSIVEYFDGAGTDMLVGGVTYDGLTGLEILHGTDVILSLKAVNGIGGVSACSEVVEFSDTSPTYISDTISAAAAQGVTTSVIDHTSTTYSEFLIFSNRMRRVGHDLYWDMDMTNHSFEPNCGLDGSAFPAYGLEFTSDPGTAMEATNTTYWYEMNSSATGSELVTLESIMSSLSVL